MLNEDKIKVDITIGSQDIYTIDTEVFNSNAAASLGSEELKFCREAQARFKTAQALLKKRAEKDQHR